ncbi:MAG: polysaccharide deacetylase [Actinomycetia bacterium]|nr:polysaccharide deacetylase [Actinomycetes bacterium]
MRLGYRPLSAMGLLSPSRRRDAPALVSYHGAMPSDARWDLPHDGNLVSTDELRDHLRLLQRRYRLIDPDDLRAWLEDGTRLPHDAVLVTCDDGLANARSHMVPVLQDAGVRALFFVTSRSTETEPEWFWMDQLHVALSAPFPDEGGDPFPRQTWWDLVRLLSRLDEANRAEALRCLRVAAGPEAARADADARFRPMNRGELAEVVHAGMTIGAHGASHSVLSLQPDASIEDEVVTTKLRLEEATGASVWAYAYPFGDQGSVGERERRAVEGAGYLCAVMNVPMPGTTDRFALGRHNVGRGTHPAELDAILSGLHDAVARRLQA